MTGFPRGWLVVAVLSVFAETAAPAAQLQSCTLDGATARCGTLRFPENPAVPGGREIPVKVIVLPRRGDGVPADPLFFLAGGPGTAMTAQVEWVNRTFGALRTDRDLVLVDQRGTGGSNRLDCAVAPETFLVPVDPARCIGRLSAFADLRAYTTDNFIADLERVRDALGYERIALYGGSYGTRAAYVYARTHPTRVSSLVLVSPAPLSMSIVDSFLEDGSAVLDRRIADCQEVPSCRSQHPSFASDVAVVRKRLASTYYTLGIGFLLYAPETAARLPAVLGRAAGGDLEPLRAAIEGFRSWAGAETAVGLHLSVMCREEVPLAKTGVAAGLGAEYARACRDWPVAALPESFHAMPRLPQPALVIAGEWDPVTPPRYGRIVADLFSPGELVIIPKGAHMVANHRCLASMTTSFLQTGTVDAGCVDRE